MKEMKTKTIEIVYNKKKYVIRCDVTEIVLLFTDDNDGGQIGFVKNAKEKGLGIFVNNKYKPPEDLADSPEMKEMNGYSLSREQIKIFFDWFRVKPYRIVCRCCKKEFKRGQWNFHSLCEPCFKQYDSQKMQGRYAKLGLPVSKIYPYYYENSDEWIAAKVCTHK